MRHASLAILLIVVAATGCGLSRMAWMPHGPATAVRSAPKPVDDWRRTSLGWERKSHWEAPAAPRDDQSLQLHPAVVAAGQLLVSLAGLVGLAKTKS